MTTARASSNMPSWMKAALGALLLGTMVFFFVDQRQKSRQQKLALAQQSELIAQQQEALAQQQAMLDEQRDTVDSVISEYKGHLEQQKAEQEMAKVLRSQQMKFAYIASGISLASSAKQYVAQYYLMEGRLPESNEDVGLPNPSRMGADGVRAIEIVRDGVIRVTFDENSGADGGVLLLQPTTDDEAGRIHWECSTEDYPEIASALPTCRYVGPE